MQYSSVTHKLIFIIFICFLFIHMAQSYYTGISQIHGSCSGIFHIYVTDCNGTVIRNRGWVSCEKEKSLFDWFEAPSLYCVHVYPQVHPKRNRYFLIKDSNSCFTLNGDEEVWRYQRVDVITTCLND